MERGKPNGDARIAIIGAGAAGLATAYYLKKNGYENVVVFEKLPRVGGLCRSITLNYKSFDLGANYITLAYRELRKIAREVGAKMYAGDRYYATTVPADPERKMEYRTLLAEILANPAGPHPITLWQLVRKLAKFIWLRFQLRSVIDRPTFENLEAYDDATDDKRKKLCVPFETWLANNQLTELRVLFEVPITMMGFGYLKETATPYVLKFMTLATFIPMVFTGIPLLGWLFQWPKRFVYGYERLWEDVAKGLNVLLDADITRIGRPGDQHPSEDTSISINFWHRGQALFDTEEHDTTLHFDYLILACPLEHEVLKRFMKVRDGERALFDMIETFAYCMTTFYLEKDLEHGVNCVFPFDQQTIGKPWAAVQMFPGASRLVQFYSRAPADEKIDAASMREVVRAAVKLAYRMDNSIAGWGRDGNPDPAQRAGQYHTFDCWPYFQHVRHTDFGKFYAGLEALQGQNNTYYVGGATNFELIEPILEYAKALVDREFPRRGSA